MKTLFTNMNILAIIVLLLPLATAYPYLWADRVLPLEVLKGAPLTPENCIRHPSTKEGSHGAPSADRAITISAVEAGAAGAAVKELCPGMAYVVTVTYPEKRRTLLSTTVGKWDKGNVTCPALAFTPKPDKAAESFKATLSVPCNATAASTTLQVTSAASPSAAFKTATLNLPIAALSKCPKSSCAAASNKTLAAGNGTAAAGNETMADSDESPEAINGTLASNGTAAGNETSTDDVMTTAANATSADNSTVAESPNATAPAAAAAPGSTKVPGGQKAAEPAASPAPAAKKSSATSSSAGAMLSLVVSVFVAAAVMFC